MLQIPLHLRQKLVLIEIPIATYINDAKRFMIELQEENAWLEEERRAKDKEVGFLVSVFFFRLLFGLLGDFVCCRCCCCFLLSLLCFEFFTLHGCYLKVTYKVLAHHPSSLFRGLLPCLCNTNTILPMSLFHPPQV